LADFYVAMTFQQVPAPTGYVGRQPANAEEWHPRLSLRGGGGEEGTGGERETSTDWVPWDQVIG
jgi:hypothetical protein